MGLRRDTVHLSLGQGFRLLLQAAYFVLIARLLGPDAFGAFTAVVAIASIAGPFAGLGTTNLFIKNVRSGKRPAALCWGNGIVVTIASGAALTVLASGISWFISLKTPPFLVLCVCVSDLILLKFTELAVAGFNAIDRMQQTAIQSVVLSGLRLAGVLILMATRAANLERWALVYLCASAVGMLYAAKKGTRFWGRPELNLDALREDIVEGLFFSVAGSATTIYNDIDKFMLSSLSTLQATGIYAAAYRVIDVSMTPVRSLAAAAYPHFFTRGSIEATYAFARSLIARSVLYGATASAMLWLLSPVIPRILGTGYEAVVPAVRWLALIPFLRCIHSFFADALSGAGFQRARTIVQAGVAALNVALNAIILKRYAWRGAAWTSLACDGLLVLFLFVTVLYYRSRMQLETTNLAIASAPQ